MSGRCVFLGQCWHLRDAGVFRILGCPAGIAKRSRGTLCPSLAGAKFACGRPEGGVECERKNNFATDEKIERLDGRVATKEWKTTMRISKRPRILLPLAIMSWMIGPSAADAQDRGQARSMVISRNGIVAAESPLAAQAGVRILERGGNAVDAAIATNAMMGVVSPMMNGIGGDLFAIVYDAKANKLYGLNASGWAPKGLTIEDLHKQGLGEMPQQGVNAITVPGEVDGWQKLADKFGRKKLAEDLAAAIRTAQDGYPVTELVAAYWAAEVDRLRGDEAAAATYLISDRAPRLGEVFRNPDLAASLQQIAEHGRQAFYKGEIPNNN